MTWIEKLISDAEKFFDEKFQKTLEEIGNWMEVTFTVMGKSDSFKDSLFILGRRLTVLGRYIFSNKNLVVFGPTASGKSTLIEYLKTGKTTGEYNPTVGTIIVDRKFEIDENFLTALRDVSGEKEFREVDWFQIINSVNPDGIVFMINPVDKTYKLEDSLSIAFDNCLRHYVEDLKRLKAFYVFLNFYDKWKDDENKKRFLATETKLKIEKMLSNYPVFDTLKIAVYKTQLAEDGSPWEEVNNALVHFSKDI